ncbi:G_PROTEIN_RECEP_F1_2 domain-containing protein [Caenorhabditis elegans]|uniref:G_PROTEIN_RECEP_F1_2 domain-containing protein n=1 Tax=Caenorhabditis elegans TaxID=6239 RepID=G5EER2_CAEEL|nr:G_PROTEIN_RECEP_F1_2 domain-containing protein [Caenorhabditis elegans]CAO82063.1 G_PROTEIN_RECEP_F1_2 domain-containing protein [Caenorhabditis elegans]|eukprot:NP_001122713.1 Uncharacterized protein CELE_R10E9.3 [Caenorhabditis elegans]
MSTLNLVDNEWTSASTSNDLEHADDGVSTIVEERTTMLGFSSFLIGVKSVTFAIYLVLLIVSVILLDISFFYTILAFGIAECFLIAITIYHGIKPALYVVLLMLAFEMTLSLVKLVFAIVLMAKDGGNDCSVVSVITPAQFYTFR